MSLKQHHGLSLQGGWKKSCKSSVWLGKIHLGYSASSGKRFVLHQCFSIPFLFCLSQHCFALFCMSLRFHFACLLCSAVLALACIPMLVRLPFFALTTVLPCVACIAFLASAALLQFDFFALHALLSVSCFALLALYSLDCLHSLYCLRPWLYFFLQFLCVALRCFALAAACCAMLAVFEERTFRMCQNSTALCSVRS